MLIAVGALLSAIGSDPYKDLQGWVAASLAILVGVVALRAVGLRSRTRRTAVAGLVLAVLSAGMLLADPARKLPAVIGSAFSVAPSAVSAEAAPGAADYDVVQAAGTLGYLVMEGRDVQGLFPSSLPVGEGGLVQTPTGSLRLPVGAVLLYTPASDGRSVSLTVIGADGRTATYDSTTNSVLPG